jgi:hypothetical protein
MDPTPHRPAIRVSIILDGYDESLLSVIWARRSDDTLTSQLWDHGVLAHVARVGIDEHRSTR